MKTIDKYLIEKLKINKNSFNPNFKFNFPVVDTDKCKIYADQTWKSFSMPDGQYVLYKDKYRSNMIHFANVLDMFISMAWQQDDYEDFDIKNDIIYASDDIDDILEYYITNIMELDLPSKKYDEQEKQKFVEKWYDRKQMNSSRTKPYDNPEVIYDFYVGQDTDYLTINGESDINDINLNNQNVLVKSLVKYMNF